MATRKTWIWIILGLLAVCVIGMFAIAGAGVYLVTSHIDTERASIAEAMRAFEKAREVFKDQEPLFELDDDERPHMLRDPADLPSSSQRPHDLVVMAWDADDERLIRIALPFWLLRLGGRNIEINDGHGFDLDRLDLDVEELERIGPVLVFDYRASSGERVLLWTQ